MLMTSTFWCCCCCCSLCVYFKYLLIKSILFLAPMPILNTIPMCVSSIRECKADFISVSSWFSRFLLSKEKLTEPLQKTFLKTCSTKKIPEFSINKLKWNNHMSNLCVVEKLAIEHDVNVLPPAFQITSLTIKNPYLINSLSKRFKIFHSMWRKREQNKNKENWGTLFKVSQSPRKNNLYLHLSQENNSIPQQQINKQIPSKKFTHSWKC